MTTSGSVKRSYRAFYCSKCKCTYSPDLDLTAEPISERCRYLATYYCANMPFKQAQATFQHIHRLPISASWLQTLIKPIAKAARDSLLKEVEPEFFPSEKDWHVVQIDGSHVPLKSSWEEAKTAVVGRLSESGKIKSRWYHATKGGASVFERDLKTLFQKRKIDPDRLIVMGDGAPWIWKLYGRQCPKAVQILDFYHASQHLAEVMELIWGVGSVVAKDEHAYLRKILKNDADGVEQVINYINNHINKDSLKREDIQKRLSANLNYFQTHKHRMRYAFFRSKGLPIGTGLVESTQKWLLQARMKRPGMHWSRKGAAWMVGLRVHLANKMLEKWYKRAMVAH